MTTPYQRLTRLRERAVEIRDELPVGSEMGELVTEFIDALDGAILLEVTTAKPTEPENDAPAVPDVIPRGFDVATFIRDCFDPRNQMAVIVS